jgi:hypothetical protein
MGGDWGVARVNCGEFTFVSKIGWSTWLVEFGTVVRYTPHGRCSFDEVALSFGSFLTVCPTPPCEDACVRACGGTTVCSISYAHTLHSPLSLSLSFSLALTLSLHPRTPHHSPSSV